MKGRQSAPRSVAECVPVVPVVVVVAVAVAVAVAVVVVGFYRVIERTASKVEAHAEHAQRIHAPLQLMERRLPTQQSSRC